MKIIQIVPLLAVASLAGMSAAAQINYTSQDRAVSVNAVGAQGSNPNGDFNSAVDLGTFDSAVQVDGGDEVNGGSAYADQYSTLDGWGMSYIANVDAYTYGEGAIADASSYFSVEFTVSSPIGYTLSGYLSDFSEQQPLVGRFARLNVGSSPSIRLFEGDNIVNELLGFGNIDESGILNPGSTYRLTADLSAFANMIYGNHTMSGIASLQTINPVPETGTAAAGLAIAGLGVWQWRRRRA